MNYEFSPLSHDKVLSLDIYPILNTETEREDILVLGITYNLDLSASVYLNIKQFI